MKSILDPGFHYTNAVNTDLRRTFARIRREQRRQQRVEAKAQPAESNLVTLDVGKRRSAA